MKTTGKNWDSRSASLSIDTERSTWTYSGLPAEAPLDLAEEAPRLPRLLVGGIFSSDLRLTIETPFTKAVLRHFTLWCAGVTTDMLIIIIKQNSREMIGCYPAYRVL